MAERFSFYNLLFCSGLNDVEYREIEKDIYANNYEVWKYLHILMIFGYSVMAVFSGMTEENTITIFFRTMMIVYSLIVSVLFFHVLKKDSRITQVLIYCSMILLLTSTIVSALDHPESVTVSFIIMLVILPMFKLGRPYHLIIFLFVFVCIFLYAEKKIVPVEVFRMDFLYALFFGVLGMSINLFYNTVRVREIIMKKQEKQYLLQEKADNDEMLRLNNTLRSMSESVVDLVGDIVEGRDAESGEHVHRVKGYTFILANQVMKDLPEYGLDQYTVNLITFTSPLHDVGKISIPDSILCKPGRLTDEEFAIMKTHCERGCSIIRKMSDRWSSEYIDMGTDICHYHHEKWDGKGYPDGLKGDEIPISAQIVSIADIFDALTTKRVYKDAYSYLKAYDMIMNGECGAFSEKLLSCFTKCRDEFIAFASGNKTVEMGRMEYELVSRNHPGDSFVIGLYDQDRTLREKLRLGNELTVFESLSESYYYVCYVDVQNNEVVRFKADESFANILDNFGDDLKSNQKFDKLLNSIIVSDDYNAFREATDRDKALEELREKGHLITDFRIRLVDGIHYCRMKITIDPNNSNAVIIGLSRRDEEHMREMEYLSVQQELESARKEIENQEKLADRLAVIDCISNEYDYVCSLNAETMDVVVYRAEAWIRDMFKNLEDIVVSPEARNTILKGIIYPADFESFLKGSEHQNVLKGLMQNGIYTVDYRAYKYGQLVSYQTRYTLDRNNPKRIIIGLRCMKVLDHQ